RSQMIGVTVICVRWSGRERSVVQNHNAGIGHLVITGGLRDLLYPALEFCLGEGVASQVRGEWDNGRRDRYRVRSILGCVPMNWPHRQGRIVHGSLHVRHAYGEIRLIGSSKYDPGKDQCPKEKWANDRCLRPRYGVLA